ncbi:MAG TPA: hypothetical protein VG056_10960, partial [Pirellulales bacterium]|nr:hypothetical protein [Pirellulales bacterium]
AKNRPEPSPDVVGKASERKGAEVDKRAEQVLREAAKTLTTIRSIEFRAEREGALVVPGGARGPVNNGYFFRLSGNLYRDDEFDEKGAATESYSFNGSMFQFFSETLSAFRESKHWMGTRPQTSFLDPISQAYSWVYPTNAPRTWETLRSRETWDDVARRTRFISEVKSEGRTIATLEIERRGETGRNFVLSVQFDKDHRCVPIAKTSYFLPDRTLSGTEVVKRFSDVDAGDAGHIRLPIEVELKWAGGDEDYRIVENTLRINQPIDADVFTLPRSRAKTNWGPYGLDEKTADFFKPRGPLTDRLVTAQDDARRNDQRVLLILGDADSDASQKLFDLREKDWRRPLYDYQQVAIAKSDSAAADSLKKTYPELAGLDWPAFVVLNEAGKVLGSRSLSLSGADTTEESTRVSDFLASHARERLDAEKLLADALARARR